MSDDYPIQKEMNQRERERLNAEADRLGLSRRSSAEVIHKEERRRLDEQRSKDLISSLKSRIKELMLQNLELKERLDKLSNK